MLAFWLSTFSQKQSFLAILQSPCPSVHTFVTDISASTGRNDFIFDVWLWHGDMYHVSPFQVYHTYTSCLQCDLEFFMIAVMKTFVTVISASIGRNDLIYGFGMVTCTVSPFPGLPHIYSLFTVRLTNEGVGVFLARRSVQHLVIIWTNLGHCDLIWAFIYNWTSCQCHNTTCL